MQKETLETLLEHENDNDSKDKKAEYLSDSEEYNITQRYMKIIFNDLKVDSSKYDPKKTVKIIENYLQEDNKMERILYSEISVQIFDLKEEGSFASNLEKLLLYSLNNNLGKDCQKIIIKIYDHFQLAIAQKNTIYEIVFSAVEQSKITIQEEIRGMEKEYISILGIFASIVLAFVGGITFSSSVLSNINKVSIYKLVLIVDMLGFILMNVIWMLINFITTINEKELKYFNIRTFNKLCLIILIIVILAWMFSIKDLEGFFHGWLPWTNKIMRVLINK